MEKEKRYTDELPFFRKIYISYMIASVLSSLAVELVSMVASSVSGQYAGSGIFAVIGLGTTGLGFFAIIKVVVCMGAYTECVRLQGSHDTEKLCAVHTSSFFMMSGLWLAAAALFLLLLHPFTYFLCGGDAGILPDLKYYCAVRIFTFLPEMVCELQIINKYKLLGQPEKVTFFTLARLAVALLSIAVLTRLKAHWVLVVLLPNAIGFLAVLLYSLRKHPGVRIIRISAKERRACEKVIFETGAPRGLNSLYFTIENLIYNAMLLASFGAELFSVRGLAAAYGPIINVLMSMSAAAMPIIGVFLAEKNSRGAGFVLKEAAKVLTPITIFLVAAGILFRIQLAELMGAGSATALKWAPYAISWYFASFIPSLLYDVMYNIHIYNQRKSMIVAFDTVKRLAITLPLNILACRTGSVRLMFQLPFLVPAVVTAALFITQLWIRRKNRQLSPYTLIDRSSENIGASVLLTAENTGSSIVRLCDQVEEFSRNNGITGSRLNLLRMSYEEVLQMIGEGAYDGSPSGQLCVYLYLTEGEVITTIRFAGKSFDPIEHIKKGRTDPDARFGNSSELRDFVIGTLIFRACKKKIYDTTFGINNLTLIFDRNKARTAVAKYPAV
jgi:Na+-driven multidrug efflux pump